MSTEVLKFVPYTSAIDATFWVSLSEAKINSWKLDTALVPIHSTPAAALGANRLLFTLSAACLDASLRSGGCIPGSLLNLNTVEAFKAEISAFADPSKNESILKSTIASIWSDISSGNALSQPNLLARFFLVSFANLKSYKVQTDRQTGGFLTTNLI